MHAGGNPRITDRRVLTRKTEFNSLQLSVHCGKSRGARTGRGSPGRPAPKFLRWVAVTFPADRKLAFFWGDRVGKTRIVEAAAEILFGDSRAIIKVDCAEFQHSQNCEIDWFAAWISGHRETPRS